MMEAMPSPLRGADGNVEFLLRARAHSRTEDAMGPPDLAAAVEEAAAPAP